MREAKNLYHHNEFRAYMRNLQGFTDNDFESRKALIKSGILNSKEKDPVTIFDDIMRSIKEHWDKPVFPTNADWHHYIVPGIILSSLRNTGYEISDKDIEEAMFRGEQLLGGSCGFAGTCGGAYSAGIVISIINKTTPLHLTERSAAMKAVVDVLNEISLYPIRCCKRSSYITIQMTVNTLRSMGFDKISNKKIKCIWSPYNNNCMRKQCPFFEEGV